MSSLSSSDTLFCLCTLLNFSVFSDLGIDRVFSLSIFKQDPNREVFISSISISYIGSGNVNFLLVVFLLIRRLLDYFLNGNVD